MPAPPLTFELVRRLERAFADFTVRRLEAYAALPGEGVELARFGAVVAPVCPSRGELDFLNRPADLWPEDVGRVGEIVDFYRARGVRPWFELAPDPDFERLAGALGDAGAAHIGFLGAFYGPPSAPESVADGVHVRRVPRERAESAGRLLVNALGAPPQAWDAGGATFAATGAQLFLASIDGEEAGAAALSLTDGVGYLAAAGTLPHYREKGVQRALICARIDAAAADGCDLVGALAELGRPSQRNLQRAGLQVAYTKAVWRLR